MRLLDLKTLVLCALLHAGASACQIVKDTNNEPLQGDDAGADARAADDREPDDDAPNEQAPPPRQDRAGTSGRDPVAGSSGGSAEDAGASASEGREPTDPVEPTTGASAADCGKPLEPPTPQCLPSDRAEPNDDDAPAMLALTPSCGYMAANLTSGEEDGYAFEPQRSDPVRVELAYTTEEVPDLEFTLRAPDGSSLTTQRDRRAAPREDIRAIFQAAAGGRYVVEIEATSGSAVCQSYALRVDPNWCTDAYEDNDSLVEATKLSWDAEETASVEGTLSRDDDDVFEITTPRGDPVLMTGEYRAAPGETIEVRRTVYDASGASFIDENGDRDTDTETFSHWLKASSKGAVLRARLWPSGSGCAPYTVKFDAAACTDAYEDNDSAESSAELPIARDVEVTAFAGDADHYAIGSLADGGSCTLRYEVPPGRSQQLRVEVYDAAGMQVTNGLGGELVGSARQLRLGWGAGRGIATIRVRADNGGYCQPYTIRCEPAAGQ